MPIGTSHCSSGDTLLPMKVGAVDQWTAVAQTAVALTSNLTEGRSSVTRIASSTEGEQSVVSSQQ